jgi:hypothetical protein
MGVRVPTVSKMPDRQLVPNPGKYVAHIALDDPEGGAKSGVIVEYVGDEDAGIVIMRGDDGVHEGYDRREVVTLLRPPIVSHGPVLLYRRHLFAVLRRPWGALSLLLVIVLVAGLIAFSHRYHWEHSVTIAVGFALIAVVIALVRADQYLLRRRKRAPDS